MNKPFFQIPAKYFKIKEFDVIPLAGYETPTNKKTGELMPNCCDYHKQLFDSLQSWFNTFPNCCDNHKKIGEMQEFDKDSFSYVPEKVLKQLSYTAHCIKVSINNKDWYKDITDYIDYNFASFGVVYGFAGVGSYEYLGYLKNWIEASETELPKNKKKLLISFIDTYYNPEKKAEQADFNIIYETYQKWLNTMPFEISFFSNLKPEFEKLLPFIKGKPEVNKYSGIAKGQMHTKSSLIDLLLNLTNDILTQINSAVLYEKGLLSEPQKIKIELAVNKRKLKLKQGYLNTSKDETTQYRRILKEWYKDEQKFINEIEPILKAIPTAEPEPTEPEIQNTVPDTTIQFDKPETIKKLHTELKGFFVGNENELLRALQGKTLKKKLLFNSNQNKFVEVFKRLKYNGYLVSQPIDIKNWICTNFEYHYKKGEISETRAFNTNTVHDILTKEKGEPRKPERICQPEWLPYKTATERNKE